VARSYQHQSQRLLEDDALQPRHHLPGRRALGGGDAGIGGPGVDLRQGVQGAAPLEVAAGQPGFQSQVHRLVACKSVTGLSGYRLVKMGYEGLY